MNRLTNAAKYAAIIMSLIVTVTMVSGCKKNNTDVSSELNKSDIEETSQDMTGSGIEDSDVGSQSAEETAETDLFIKSAAPLSNAKIGRAHV